MRLALGTVLLTLGASDARAQLDHVARCKSEVRGTMIWMSSAVGNHRPELSTRLNDVDIPAYCECFHARLRAALGDGLYSRSRSLTGQLSNAELARNMEEDGKAVIACVEAQVTGRTAPAASGATGELPHQDKFLRFIGSTVSPGGIGGLKLGGPKTAMFEVLGPTKAFKPGRDGGEDYYYGPNSTEVTISISPPPARVVRKIAVGYRFQGQTPGGGRIGDTRDRIKSSYPGTLAIDAPAFAVYCDGTTFYFEDGRLRSIRLADLDSDVFKDARLRRCSN